MRSDTPSRGRRVRIRPILRALHRDVGYLLVGLTLVYALSGLAVNHIADWDPNFASFERTVWLDAPLSGNDQAVAAEVLAALDIDEAPQDVYRLDDAQLEISFERRSVHVDTETGRVIDEGQDERFLLRLANWLHLNRGKAAWTYVADGYALLLLFLATSGMFMLPGRGAQPATAAGGAEHGRRRGRSGGRGG